MEYSETQSWKKWIRRISALAVEFTSDDLREIESAISKITVQGDRYPSDMKKMTDR